jgi:hypothetical protein
MLTRGRARGTFRDLFERGVLAVWLPELDAFLRTPATWPTEAGGTHEEASHGEPEDVPAPHATWNLLGAADRVGLAARTAPDALALAALFGPWLRSTFDRGRRRAWPAWQDHVEREFRPIAVRMSIPRAAYWEMREVLWMLDELRHPPPAARRRRLAHRPAFRTALAYLELDLRARDGDLALLEMWEQEAEAAGARPRARRGTAQAARDEERPRRGRRGRRGGRGRGSREAVAGGSRGVTPEADAWDPPPG